MTLVATWQGVVGCRLGRRQNLPSMHRTLGSATRRTRPTLSDLLTGTAVIDWLLAVARLVISPAIVAALLDIARFATIHAHVVGSPLWLHFVISLTIYVEDRFGDGACTEMHVQLRNLGKNFFREKVYFYAVSRKY